MQIENYLALWSVVDGRGRPSLHLVSWSNYLGLLFHEFLVGFVCTCQFE
jgi:hypothetical protein